MKITQTGTLFNETKIQQLVNLLGKDIANINGSIHVYTNKEKAIKNYEKMVEEGVYFDEGFLDGLKKGSVHGSFCSKDNQIMLYNFNLLKSRFPKVDFVFSLFHELRHAYQYTYLKDKMMAELKKGIPYEERWSELEANYYASMSFMKYRNDISKITNEIYGGYFSDMSEKITKYEQYMKKKSTSIINGKTFKSESITWSVL